MADVMDVSPTRGTLLRLREDLEGIQARHDLLDRKREVLVRELMDRLEKAEELETESRDHFQEAHEAIRMARMRMGSDRVDSIDLSPAAWVEAKVTTHTLMGVKMPQVELDIDASALPYGLHDTSAALDEAREKWLDVLRFLGEAAETLTAVWRLAAEMRKTRRQVNALKTTLIPRYRRTIGYIEGRLEEEEREDVVHAKQVKKMSGERK